MRAQCNVKDCTSQVRKNPQGTWAEVCSQHWFKKQTGKDVKTHPEPTHRLGVEAVLIPVAEAESIARPETGDAQVLAVAVEDSAAGMISVELPPAPVNVEIRVEGTDTAHQQLIEQVVERMNAHHRPITFDFSPEPVPVHEPVHEPAPEPHQLDRVLASLAAYLRASAEMGQTSFKFEIERQASDYKIVRMRSHE